MASQFPVQTWGRLISPNEDELPAQMFGDTPASISITMAALDPGEEWSNNAGIEEFKGKKPRATIKMLVYPAEDSDDDEEDSDDETDPNLAALLDAEDSDEDTNGEGPSDLNKSPKARLAQELLGHDKKATVNGVGKKDKGKGKATVAVKAELDDEVDEDEDIDSDDIDMDMNDLPEEYVLCTLDPDSHYQQPLNIVISPNENVFFRVEGTHSVHLTGNYLADDGFDDDDEYDSDEYDLEPDEDELADLPSDLDGNLDDDSDELDDMADPRVTEVDSDEDEDEDEEEVPALTKSASKKGANKRAAAEDDSDAEMAEPEDKPLSKAQLKKMRKKLKDNAGNALDIASAATTTANGTTIADATADLKSAKGDKKVQFAKTLVQGPTASGDSKGSDDKKKPSLGVKTVQGVTIDDKKLGSGPAAKNGARVSMRYIGKLDASKRVFDSNKKGKPFAFKLGAGEVIRGWDIGVQGMQAGGERRITIPAHLAYGSKKMGDIPANSDLVFDLKVLEIK